ncbi:hypothetical protein P8C59_007332 [Phyllachora maydis]|uniref:Vacuolar ATPase assembly integral membrane protein VMA21 n=1 Tax=Phyllachora maydis TaxID=1825666 RepID=A0AAD9I8P7_9PEZI|nr:hypothetical protein P8C59_007332 [Phyllachora maydis]
MATRRIISQEKTLLEKDDRIGASPAAGEKANIAPAVPTAVIVKLLGFTLAMVVVPIGSYFLTVDMVFGGNSTLAGALAAVMANVVLVAYVVTAMREDQSERNGEKSQEGKKDR